eukprot:2729944-Rhodomonas_salina.1
MDTCHVRMRGGGGTFRAPHSLGEREREGSGRGGARAGEEEPGGEDACVLSPRLFVHPKPPRVVPHPLHLEPPATP